MFDAAALDRRYAFLDGCPDALFRDVVTLPVGALADRVAGVVSWRDALLAGRLPPASEWPPSGIGTPVRKALEELDLVRFCKDQPDLVDALMKDIIGALGRSAQAHRSDVADRLRELERLERVRLAEAEAAPRRKRGGRSRRLSDEDLGLLRERAEREADGAERDPDEGLVGAWEERVRAWVAIADVFGDLGSMMGRGWDLSRGVLRHAGWLDLLRLSELVKQLPELREVVRALGRLHATDDGASVAERVLDPVRRLEEERREVRTPLVPSETRGLERSGEIARMLPVEAAMLGHPKLRMLWHARRAERALLTYRVEGVEVERVMVEREGHAEADGERPRPERGPILAVIDTSGSMHGLPERVAKAIVLEAVRTAHAERRRCVLFAYSGPGQIIEEELDISPDGVGRLLAFLGLTFGGGSDEAGVLARVVERLDERDWQKADVVLVSDGEWPGSSGLTATVERARERGTRFHGVQVGNRGRTGLHSVCDPVHVFQDWAEAGGWNRRVDQPR